MLIPSIFGEDLFDNFFEYPHRGYHANSVNNTNRNGNRLMKTDIWEHKDGYEVDLQLPGYRKEDIHVTLKDGYLTINADMKQNEQRDEKSGRYICRECYSGSCSRSFYVGKDVTQQDIRAKYENGVLSLFIPKKDPKKPEVEESKYITIEG